jgi:hypothetical protein
MSEADERAADAVPDDVPQEASAPTEGEAPAEAAPAKPKERVKRPTRPNDESHKQKVDALQQTSERPVVG